MKNKIFLGGTCADTTWREELIALLTVDYFNPVVEDWTPDAQVVEEYQKEKKCNIHFYMITSAMKGVFSIAEVIESSVTAGKVTILQIDKDQFDEAQLKSLDAVSKMVIKHGGIVLTDTTIRETATVLNFCFK